MKKNMVLIASFCTLFAYSMEKENRWSIQVNEMIINVNKGDLRKIYCEGQKKVDFIVVGCQGKWDRVFGRNITLSHPRHDTPMGCCWDDVVIHTSAEGEPIAMESEFQFREDYNVCIMIAQPYVEEGTGSYIYNSRRLGNDKKTVFAHHRGDKAIKEALQDVEVCYKSALTFVAKKNDAKVAKSIALPVLGYVKHPYNPYHPFSTDVVAPVAIKAIFEFIKNNPGVYDSIELFVEDKSDFDLCQKLLLEANESIFTYLTKKFF